MFNQSVPVLLVLFLTLSVYALALKGLENPTVVQVGPDLEVSEGRHAGHSAPAENSRDTRDIQGFESVSEAEEKSASAIEAPYLLPQYEEKELMGRKQRGGRGFVSLSTVVRMGLAVAIIALLGMISWDVMNFVGDVPDPFKHVERPEGIPAAIDKLLAEQQSLAFVVRMCKYCGQGIRAMKMAGRYPVVVMVEGHPFEVEIRSYLRSQYGVRGLPYFFLDGTRHGHLAKMKSYLAKEST